MTGASFIGGDVGGGSGGTGGVDLEDLVEFPLAHELIAVGVGGGGLTSEGFDFDAEPDRVEGGVVEEESAVHLGRVGKLGHDDPGGDSLLSVLSLKQNTSDLTSCSKAIVSAGVAASVSLSQEVIVVDKRDSILVN